MNETRPPSPLHALMPPDGWPRRRCAKPGHHPAHGYPHKLPTGLWQTHWCVSAPDPNDPGGPGTSSRPDTDPDGIIDQDED